VTSGRNDFSVGCSEYAIILGLCAATWSINFAWLAADTRPPVWDMAMHQAYALNYLPGRHPPLPPSLWSGTYPPFVHLAIAACYAALHVGRNVAALANLPASLLLLAAVYFLARDIAGRAAARWTCLLTALTPQMLWMSRETILDYWLSAWFALALLALRWCRSFESRAAALLLGATIALGMLTKWLFAGLIVFPLLLVLVRHRVWRHTERAVNLLDVFVVAAGFAAFWYLPNLPRLVSYFGENMSVGAREGEPPVLSFQSLIYYARLLEGYQLFAVLFVVAAAGAVVSLRRKLLSDPVFWAVSVAGGWLVFTLLRTKDPRFTMPLIGPLFIGAGAWIASWRQGPGWKAAKLLLVAVLCVQAYAVNFGLRWLPRSVVLMKGYQGSLRWDWNLYLQDYFGILGPPRREDWRQQEILDRIAEHSRQNHGRLTLAVVPDLPRFSAATFHLQAKLKGISLLVDHPQSASEGVRAFDGFSYVLMIDGDQGMPWTTQAAPALNQIIVDRHDLFRIVQLYPLPNGDYVRLYYVAREDKSGD
jgi:4-amino-4-deoxy-L-arabinose transferase-like glycosyltransferase